MVIALLVLSLFVFAFGVVRLLIFKRRLKKYDKVKAEVTNLLIESRYVNRRGTVISENDYMTYYRYYDRDWREVKYYSPELTYYANDGEAYTGNWWTETKGRLPFNIGEKVEIYCHPEQPAKFFMYDKVMMFYEPLIVAVIGLVGVVFFSFYINE